MRPRGVCTQGVRLVKMLRIIEREQHLTSGRYAVEFGVDYRTWSRDVRALRDALAPFGEHIRRHGWILRLTRDKPTKGVVMRAKDIENLKTLAVGQAADLKIDTGTFRVWLNRVTNEVEYERLIDGRWVDASDED
jgi:hypothetical protein